VLQGLGSEVPLRWAVLTSNRVAVAAGETDGRLAFGDAIIRTLNGDGVTGDMLSLEQFIDQSISRAESAPGTEAVPDVTGRFDPNITMVQRK
jgi:hypothetical protein